MMNWLMALCRRSRSSSWLLARRVIGIIVSTLPVLCVGPLFRLPAPFGRIDPVPVRLELRAAVAALLNVRTRHVGDVATLSNPGSLTLFGTRSVDLRLLAALTALLDFGLGAYDRVGNIARLPCPTLVPASFRRPRVRPGYLLLSAPTAMPVSAFVPRPFTIMPIMINFEREDHHRQSNCRSPSREIDRVTWPEKVAGSNPTAQALPVHIAPSVVFEATEHLDGMALRNDSDDSVTRARTYPQIEGRTGDCDESGHGLNRHKQCSGDHPNGHKALLTKHDLCFRHARMSVNPARS
jgi:hypothetical protein